MTLYWVGPYGPRVWELTRHWARYFELIGDGALVHDAEAFEDVCCRIERGAD
jgi:hypothetical protein